MGPFSISTSEQQQQQQQMRRAFKWSHIPSYVIFFLYINRKQITSDEHPLIYVVNFFLKSSTVF